MSILSVLVLAVALAMDAFAVSICSCLSADRCTPGRTTRIALHFGVFQGVMPVLGWLAGRTLHGWVASCDHWVAFILLGLIGGNMIRESFGHDDHHRPDPAGEGTLLLLSLATSIDALAVGLSFAMLEVSIWLPCLIIGTVTAALSYVGCRFGSLLGQKFGHRMEALGGTILILIGLRILAEHLTLF